VHVRVSRVPALLGVLATLLSAQPAVAQATDQTVIRVGEVATDLNAESYYAADMDFFEKAGLKVQLTTFANGGAVAGAVAAGAMDIGISNSIAVASAYSRGVPLQIVALGGMYSTKSPSTALAVAKKSPIKLAQDFQGKTIAVSSLNNLEQIAAQAWLGSNDVDPAGVKFVEIHSTAMGPALARGTVDGAMITEPALSMSLAAGEIHSFAKVFDTIAPQFPIGIWVTTSAYAKAHPELVKKFAAVMYETGKWANTNPALTAPILAKYSKIDPAEIKGMARSRYAEALDLGGLQKELDIAFKYKQIQRSVNASELVAKG
jgi:NitT/TauT family transport system substrate-binding protein